MALDRGSENRTHSCIFRSDYLFFLADNWVVPPRLELNFFFLQQRKKTDELKAKYVEKIVSTHKIKSTKENVEMFILVRDRRCSPVECV